MNLRLIGTATGLGVRSSARSEQFPLPYQRDLPKIPRPKR